MAMPIDLCSVGVGISLENSAFGASSTKRYRLEVISYVKNFLDMLFLSFV